mmetsp:Transcript_94636/g.276663  ORF Transcript_94636/g.276663 Transcript_94636/m.276663 type:complete len:272 (-) Transcript_94636:330-1145(-)
MRRHRGVRLRRQQPARSRQVMLRLRRLPLGRPRIHGAQAGRRPSPPLPAYTGHRQSCFRPWESMGPSLGQKMSPTPRRTQRQLRKPTGRPRRSRTRRHRRSVEQQSAVQRRRSKGRLPRTRLVRRIPGLMTSSRMRRRPLIQRRRSSGKRRKHAWLPSEPRKQSRKKLKSRSARRKDYDAMRSKKQVRVQWMLDCVLKSKRKRRRRSSKKRRRSLKKKRRRQKRSSRLLRAMTTPGESTKLLRARPRQSQRSSLLQHLLFANSSRQRTTLC